MKVIETEQNVFKIKMGEVFTGFHQEGHEAFVMRTVDIRIPNRNSHRTLMHYAPHLTVREAIDILNNLKKLIK